MSSEFQPLVRFVSKYRLKTFTTSIVGNFLSSTPIEENPTDPDWPTTSTRSTVLSTLSLKMNTTEIPIGFFDSLFLNETTDETYMKVMTIFLWIIAFLCLPIAIKSLLKAGLKSSRMILIHVLLCEFTYLFYILLSMINVAMNFRLNLHLCDIANYGKLFEK